MPTAIRPAACSVATEGPGPGGTAPAPRERITGLVLAGGRGLRMGGVDKGLQPWAGGTLAANALARLAPQVGPLAVSANRHADAYAALGVPVWADPLEGFPGPLGGFLAGLRRAGTPWLATVPCDTPHFPPDLVARLAAAAALAGAPIAMPSTLHDGRWMRQPVFCLLHTRLAASLDAFLAAGGRKIGVWADEHGAVTVPFADAPAFANANTPDDLDRLARGEPLPHDD